MKKRWIFNSEILKVVANLGHRDQLMLTDLAFPIPIEAKKIDLAISRDFPKMIDVLDNILTDCQRSRNIIRGWLKRY